MLPDTERTPEAKRTPARVSSRAGRTAHPLTAAEIKRAAHSGRTYQRRGDGPPLPAKEVLWDSTMRGLGLRLLPDRKVWIIRYAVDGRERLAKLGDYPALSLDRARELARVALGKAQEGKDPRPRRARGERLRDFLPLFLERSARGVKRSTLASYEKLGEVVAESLGGLQVATIGPRDVLAAFRAWTEKRGPVRANQALGLLRRALHRAQREGLRPADAPDPCAMVDRNRERRRGREITGAELARVGEALDKLAAERPQLRAAVQVLHLLALTGARKGEIARLTWGEVDLSAGLLRLADTKSGAQSRAMPAAAAAILAAIRGECPDPDPAAPVFPAATYDLVGYTWRLARKMAGCPDLRVHDLRHAVVTRGLASGLSAVTVGRMVGHRSVASTLRYEHVASAGDPIRQAADRVADEIGAAMRGQPAAEVVPLSRSDSGSQ